MPPEWELYLAASVRSPQAGAQGSGLSPWPIEDRVRAAGVVPGTPENKTCSSHLQPPGVAHTTPGTPARGSRTAVAEGGGNVIGEPGPDLQATIPAHQRPESLLQDQTAVPSVEGWAERPPPLAWGSCR